MSENWLVNELRDCLKHCYAAAIGCEDLDCLVFGEKPYRDYVSSVVGRVRHLEKLYFRLRERVSIRTDLLERCAREVTGKLRDEVRAELKIAKRQEAADDDEFAGC